MMKNWITTTMLSLILAVSLIGQEPVFTVQTNYDSLLLGNHLELTFTLENAKDGNFESPTFDGFRLLSGPNYSSMMSIVNGEVSQKKSYTFILEPKDIGNYFIEPSSIEVGDKVLETQPIEIIVLPNPDGIIQEPKNQTDQMDWFFNYSPPSFFRDDEPVTKPRKKRKIYKI